MATSSKPAALKREPWNLSFDKELKTALKTYCQQNRKAGDPSDVIEDEIIKLIARKGRKYGLRVPKHLLPK